MHTRARVETGCYTVGQDASGSNRHREGDDSMKTIIIGASEVEPGSVRFHGVLADRFPDVETVFTEPVPRDDR